MVKLIQVKSYIKQHIFELGLSGSKSYSFSWERSKLFEETFVSLLRLFLGGGGMELLMAAYD